MSRMFSNTLILYIAFIETSLATVNPVGPNITNEYSQCLLRLVEDNFARAGLLIVANTYNASASPVDGIRTILLREVQRTLNYIIQVVSPEELDPKSTVEGDSPNEDEDLNDFHNRNIDDFDAVPLADYYVVVVGGYTQFKQIIMKLSTLRSWNPRAQFLIMCFKFYKPNESVEHYPELILTHMFLLNVVNAIVMVPEQHNRRMIRIFGWRPFDPPKYCGYTNESATGRLILENICNKGVIESSNPIFYDRIPHSMEGCQLEAIALVRRPFVNDDNQNPPGIERSLMDEVARSLRIDIRYATVQMQRGEKTSSKEWSGALGHLMAARCHLVFGAVFPDNDVHEDFEASVPYFSDSYTWVVPRASSSPTWLALVVIFDRYVWLSAAVAYVGCMVAWRLLAQFSDESPYHRDLGHCALNAWYTTLGFCAYMRPLGQSLRIFFIFFTLYSVLFITAYQTKLIDVLTNPSFEEQLSTVEELVQSTLKWGGLEELQDLFDQAEDDLDKIIGIDFHEIENEITALTDVVVHKNFSLLGSRLAILDASARSENLSDHNGLPNYYTFEENVFSIPVEFVTLKGFPFMDRMCYLVAAFKEMGVMSRILGEYRARTARRRARLMESTIRNLHSDDLNTGGGRRLSLGHLQGGFLVLAVGYIGGIVVFALELLSSCKWYNKFQNKIIKSIKKKQLKKTK